MFYDYKLEHISMYSENIFSLLKIEKTDDLTIDVVASRFSPTQWKSFEILLASHELNQNFNKSGILELTNNDSTFYIQYNAASIVYESDTRGLLIWFVDCTQMYKDEVSVINSMKKYRMMSYELDTLFNYIPFPIWRREHDGRIVFCNQAYYSLLTDDLVDSGNGIVQEIDPAVKKNIPDSNSQKTAIIKDVKDTDKATKKFEFTQLFLGKDVGSIGYGADVTARETCNKKVNLYLDMISKIIEESNVASMIVDSKWKIWKYNDDFIEIFELDREWLDTAPLLSILLDKLRVSDKLPEAHNYEEYKELQMHLYSSIDSTYRDIMHLSCGTVVELVIVSLPNNYKLFQYRDITENIMRDRDYNSLLTLCNTVINVDDSPLVFLNTDASIKLCNKAFMELIGIASDNSVVSRHITSVLRGIKAEKGMLDMIESYFLRILDGMEDSECTLMMLDGGAYTISYDRLPASIVYFKFTKAKEGHVALEAS